MSTEPLFTLRWVQGENKRTKKNECVLWPHGFSPKLLHLQRHMDLFHQWQKQYSAVNHKDLIPNWITFLPPPPPSFSLISLTFPCWFSHDQWSVSSWLYQASLQGSGPVLSYKARTSHVSNPTCAAAPPRGWLRTTIRNLSKFNSARVWEKSAASAR